MRPKLYFFTKFFAATAVATSALNGNTAIDLNDLQSKNLLIAFTTSKIS